MPRKPPPAKPPAGPLVEPGQGPLARCKPRGDRVVVRRDIAKTHTRGGLILPDSFANAREQTGVVVSAGPAVTDLKPGDRVIITGYAGLEVRDVLAPTPDDEYVILRQDDILATLPG